MELKAIKKKYIVQEYEKEIKTSEENKGVKLY